jgi:tetratricopeptide (TPR) repeat protein
MSLATRQPSGVTTAQVRGAAARRLPSYAPDLVVSLLLVLVTAWLYAPVAEHKFLYYDDPAYVTHNEHINTGFSRENLWWALTVSHAANWHPLTWMSHMLDVELYGHENARGHHLTNVALHIVNAVLLFLSWRMLLIIGPALKTVAPGSADTWHDHAAADDPQGDAAARGGALTFWVPAFIAAVFAWHPLHVESVAWVAERKDMLSGLFFMLILLAYASYVQRPGWRRYALVALLLAVGLLCKPSLVTVPFVLWLLDYWPLDRWHRASASETTTWRLLTRGAARSLVQKLPLLAIVLAASIATIVAQRGGGSVQRLDVLPVWPRIANVVISYWTYIQLTFWPTNLAVFYPHPYYIGLLTWDKVAVAAVLLTLICGLVAWQARRRPWLPVGWLWYLGILVPMIGILQVGDQSHANRYTYLTQTGLVLMVATSVAGLAARAPGGRWFAAACGCLALAGCLWRSSVELQYWENQERLFRRAMEVTQRNYMMGVGMAREMVRQKKFDEAIAYFDQARIDGPKYFEAQRGLARLLGDRGMKRLEQGDLDGGIADLREAMACAPEGKWRLPAHEVWIGVGNNLAWHLATNPHVKPLRPDEALDYATRVCETFSDPNTQGSDQLPYYLDALAAAYAAAGNYSDAIKVNENAIALAERQAANATDAKVKAQFTSFVATLRTRMPAYWSLKPYQEEPQLTAPAAASGGGESQNSPAEKKTAPSAAPSATQATPPPAAPSDNSAK